MHSISLVPDSGFRRLILVFCLSLCLSRSLCAVGLPRIKLIFLMPANHSKTRANFTAPAIIVALNRIQADQLLPNNTEVQLVVKESQCSPTLTAVNFQDVYNEDEPAVNGIFGGFCPSVCNILKSISLAVDVIFVGVDCNIDSSKERDRGQPSSFLTMSFWRPSLTLLFNFVMKSFGWTRIAVLATSDEQSSYFGRTIKKSVESNNHTAFFFLYTVNTTEENKPLSGEELNEVEMILEEMKKHARVFFFAMDPDVAARVLIVAQKKGMYNGEYVFIGSWLEWVRATRIGAMEEEWELAREGLITLEPLHVEQNDQFIRDVNEVSRNIPELSWISLQFLTDKNKRSEYLAKDVYSAVLLFAYVLNITIPKVNDFSSLKRGSFLLSEVRNLRFTAASDTIHFDANGYRRTNWTAKNLMKNGESRILAYYDYQTKTSKEADDLLKVTWPGGGSQVPLDHPQCGWDNNCLRKIDLILICVCSILGGFAIIGAFLALFVWRRMKTDMERRTFQEWQVKWSRVAVIGDSKDGRLSTAEVCQSKTSCEIPSQADSNESQSARKTSQCKLFTLAGIYKGKMVAIKKIQRESVNIYLPTIYSELNCSTSATRT